MDYSLCYQGCDLNMIGCKDVDWEGDLDKIKPTLRYVVLCYNGAISWVSKKQTCIALSTWNLYLWQFQWQLKRLFGLNDS